MEVSLRDKSREELLAYCIEKKNLGMSFREFASLFDKHEIKGELRQYLMSELDKIDKQNKPRYSQTEDSPKKRAVKIVFAILLVLLASYLVYEYLIGYIAARIT